MNRLFGHLTWLISPFVCLAFEVMCRILLQFTAAVVFINFDISPEIFIVVAIVVIVVIVVAFKNNKN